jgi:acyl carrier protein
MTKTEFLELIDEMIEADPGTVEEGQALDKLDGWDSLAMVGLLAAVHERLGVTLSADQISKARRVSDLLDLVSEKVAA